MTDRKRPPEGTKPNTLHWLYRGTGAPHWTVATWMGDDGWQFLGETVKAANLTWWEYRGPAHPPEEDFDSLPEPEQWLRMEANAPR